MVDPRSSLVPQTSVAIEPTRGVLDLARSATIGEVAARRHAASRERLLDRLSRPAGTGTIARRSAGRNAIYALAAAAAFLGLLSMGVAVTFASRSRPVPAAVDSPVDPQISLGEGAPSGAAKAISPFRYRFRDCWRQGLVGKPATYGSATLALAIDDAGHVASSSLAERQGLPENVAHCFVRATGDIAFEPGAASAFRVTIAFREE